MKYTVKPLDARFAYRSYFKYYVGFSASMTQNHGPIAFNDVLAWFIDTYGWSAEVREYAKIMRWTHTNQMASQINQNLANDLLLERSPHCNPYWSWSNGYADLRVYVASDKELSFFKLKFPKG